MEVMASSKTFLFEKMIESLSFEPTSCQKEMFLLLSKFITSNPDENWLMVINGYAGTGKTSALSALIKVLKKMSMRYILLAPTGRSAKVLSNFTGEKASTIHRHIYRQKSLEGGIGSFSLDINKSTDTIFIVDEVSLISSAKDVDSIFGSGDTLSDLITYIKSNSRNRLILVGDHAQLPPIGLDNSPALDLDYLSSFTPNVFSVTLTEVVRQATDSGILMNATSLRNEIENGELKPPRFNLSRYDDIKSLKGGELIEELTNCIGKYGIDEVVVLCRSNLRANRYNQGIRNRVLFLEEKLQRGDKLMVVKNCYNFEGKGEELDFIANGDVATLVKIHNYEERYGFHFADAILSFSDYNDIEIEAKIILDTLDSSSSGLNKDEQLALFEGVFEDYNAITSKKKRYKAVREDPYFNALQIKYSTAITGHKSQGGQWKCVFIDNILWQEEISLDDKKWLYTAITRGIERVYLVNFPEKYLD